MIGGLSQKALPSQPGKKSPLLNIHLIDQAILTDPAVCHVHTDLVRLDLPENASIHHIHREYMGKMVDLARNASVPRDWGEVDRVMGDLLEAVLTEYRMRKRGNFPNSTARGNYPAAHL
jgi:hypothetical protein